MLRRETQLVGQGLTVHFRLANDVERKQCDRDKVRYGTKDGILKLGNHVRAEKQPKSVKDGTASSAAT